MLELNVITSLLFYSFACLGLGGLTINVLTGLSSLKAFSPLLRITTYFILGIGILSTIWLLLALAGLFMPPVVLCITIILGLLGVVLIWKESRYLKSQVLSLWHNYRSDTWIWKITIGLIVLLCVASATSIGNVMERDALAFYMALPKVISASWRLIPLPGFEVSTSFGLLGELHYAAFITLGNPDAARMFHWLTILVGGVMLVGICSFIQVGWKGKWIALLMMFSSSSVVVLMGDGKVDFFAAAIGLAAYFWALQASENPDPKYLWLAGIFCGFAVVAKITYMIALVPGVILLIGWSNIVSAVSLLKNGNPRNWFLWFKSLVKSNITFGFWFILATLPNLLKNYLIFHKLIITDVPLEWYGKVATLKMVFTYPFVLAFGDYDQYGNLSPLFLAFIPFALLLPRIQDWRKDRFVRLSIIAVFGILLWIIVVPSIFRPRYYLATLLILYPLAAFCTGYVLTFKIGGNYLRIGILGCMIITVISTYLISKQNTFGSINDLSRYFVNVSECSGSPVCSATQPINQGAGQGQRVLMLTYIRYFLRSDLIQCSSGDKDGLIWNIKDEEMWRAIYRNGFTYILGYVKTHGALLAKIQQDKRPSWVNLEELYSDGRYFAFRIKYSDVPSDLTIKTKCQQINSPAWDMVNLSP